MPSAADRYRWAGDWASMGVCVAAVDDPEPHRVLGRLVRRPATPVLSHDEAAAWVARADATAQGDYVTVVEAAPLGAWTVTLEVNGYEATCPGVAERLSTDGHRAVVLFRNVNAVMQFIWAVDGEVVRSFDPLLYDVPGVGAPLPEEAQLTFGIDGPPVSASFAMIELLTGLRLTQEWLDDRTTWVGIGHRPR